MGPNKMSKIIIIYFSLANKSKMPAKPKSVDILEKVEKFENQQLRRRINIFF
jgi:hypothetical protein